MSVIYAKVILSSTVINYTKHNAMSVTYVKVTLSSIDLNIDLISQFLIKIPAN